MNLPNSATLVPEPGEESVSMTVLAVMAGGEAYGIPLSAIREILMPPPLTEVPRADEHFLGVISVRGDIITVVDLPGLLRLETAQPEPYARVLLVDNGRELIGVAVNRVIQVYRLESDQLEYASAMGAELSEYVVGVGRVPDVSAEAVHEMLILIDPVALLGQ